MKTTSVQRKIVSQSPVSHAPFAPPFRATRPGPPGTFVLASVTSSPDSRNSFPDPRNGFPDSGNSSPNSGNSFPNSGNGFPNSGNSSPDSGSGFTDSRNAFPNSGSGYPNSGSGYPNSGSGFPNSGRGFPNSGSGFPDSGSGFTDSENHFPRRGNDFPSPVSLMNMTNHHNRTTPTVSAGRPLALEIWGKSPQAGTNRQPVGHRLSAASPSPRLFARPAPTSRRARSGRGQTSESAAGRQPMT